MLCVEACVGGGGEQGANFLGPFHISPSLPRAGETGPPPLHGALGRGVGSPCLRWLSSCHLWPVWGPFRDLEREFSEGLLPEGWRWAVSVLQLNLGPDDSIPESENTLPILFSTSCLSPQPRHPLVRPSRRLHAEIMGQGQGGVHRGDQEASAPDQSRAAELELPPEPVGRLAPHGCSGAHGVLSAGSLELLWICSGSAGGWAQGRRPRHLESESDPLPSCLPPPPPQPACCLAQVLTVCQAFRVSHYCHFQTR